jgi:Fe2+ or Zn2+ uptake regulation protein
MNRSVGAMRSPAELTDAFRANGLKVTPQRQLLFRLLHGNESHPSAESLYVAASTEMPGISLRTVYQTLTDLAAMGELSAIEVGTGAARFDPNGAVHHHLVCERCGAVRDVYLEGVDELHATAALDGFLPTRTEVVLRGLCAACAGAHLDA